MTIKLAIAARRAACDTIVDRVDLGAPPGKLRIYGGAQPADPDTATAATLLAEVTLANPAFGSADTSAVAALVDPASVNGVAAGTATWFRIVAGGTAAGAAGVIDGSVSATGGGGDLTLNTTTISVGVAVDITGGSITHP